MKPEIYAAKQAIVLIPIAMMRMIRSSVVIPANMTQDRGISFEYIVSVIGITIGLLVGATVTLYVSNPIRIERQKTRA